VHVTTGGGAYPRLVVSLAPGARAELIEYHLSVGDADSISVPVADVELGAGAELRHHSLGLGSARAIRLEDVAVRVGADARYLHRHVALGGQIGRLDLRVELAAPGALTDLAGLFIAREQRQLDVRTLVRHLAPRTRSEQLYRGVAGDRGRGSYDGKVVVHAGAAKADSRQSSRNLLLSAQARIDTRPQLEINTDDVKCSHGATTGTLDEQMLFYLLARGIERDTARALLTFAFAEDVLARLEVPALRRFTEERVLGNLPAANLIREFVR
jgi:Fe-S cluster assembly protein SufD